MDADIYQTLKQNLAEEKLCALATIVSGPRTGATLLIDTQGKTLGDLGDAALSRQVVADAPSLMRLEKSENRTFGDAEVFIDVYAPKPKLVIFGGVHTAIPLTTFAQALGFHVTIVDGRARFATRERFPTADEVMVAWPDEAVPRLNIDSSTYVAILTHDPKFDIPALAALAAPGAAEPRYIGSMGSRETRRQHFEELRARGVSDEFLATVHGPIGLDIGARSAEEMALAILAEIVAVRYMRGGGFLSERGGQENM